MEKNLFLELLAKKLSGQLSELDNALWENMILEYPEWEYEFEILSSYWKNKKPQIPLTKLEQAWEMHFSKFHKDFEDDNESISVVKRPNTWRISFIICILLICFFLFFNKKNPVKSFMQPFNLTVETKSNEVRKINLPDGTLVMLNANSILQWDTTSFGKEERTVFLIGEAYFDVIKNKERPFYVKTTHSQIKVTGTAFNVRDYHWSNREEATLLRGKIEIVIQNAPHKTYYLKPNDKIIVNYNLDGKGSRVNVLLSKAQFIKYNGNDYAKETTWLQDEFVWENDSLSVIADQLSSRYGKVIQFLSDKVKEYKFSGSISNNNFVKVLETLRSIRPFNYTISNDTVRISE